MIDYPNMGIFYPVPREPTPLKPEDMATPFVEGHLYATDGKWPGSRRMLVNALSIIGVENGNGRSFICHNWGNIMANLQTWRGPFWIHPQPQAGQPIEFRAYRTHLEGATAWWRLMYGRYRPVLELAAAGRPRAMVHELYTSGYVVGPPSQANAYADTAASLAASYHRDSIFSFLPLLRSDYAAIAAAGVSLVGAAVATVVTRAR